MSKQKAQKLHLVEHEAPQSIDLDNACREDFLNLIPGFGARGFIADHFAKYAESYALGRFLMRYELFKLVENVHGSIIECGCKTGVGILEWYQISKLIEPLGRRRVIYGFDTFTGKFPSGNPKDGPSSDVEALPGAFATAQEIMTCVRMLRVLEPIMSHDRTKSFNPKLYAMKEDWDPVDLVQGDFMETGQPFLEAHPHLVISLLYLDFDLYAPTKKALELFLPRMPAGSIIAFDELDHPDWPGETLAVMDTVGLRNLALKRFPWVPTVSYAILGKTT
jgi:hypothetical protein